MGRGMEKFSDLVVGDVGFEGYQCAMRRAAESGTGG
jgi:hypothetical protein